MLIVGERINASRKAIGEAISSGNADWIRREAGNQANSGANYIDINAGIFADKEPEYLRWLAQLVQEVTELPICVDSPDPAAMRAVLPVLKRAPMLNSITLEPERYEGVLPLVLEHHAKVVALCQSSEVTPQTVEDKLSIAEKLVGMLLKSGVPADDIYVDPLVYPVATDTNSALATLGAIEEIHRRFTGVHTICGLTNVSYGLPERKLLNRVFMIAAVARGLDAVILDPTDAELMKSLCAARVISGRDEYCMQFISAVREGFFAKEPLK